MGKLFGISGGLVLYKMQSLEKTTGQMVCSGQTVFDLLRVSAWDLRLPHSLLVVLRVERYG